MTDLEIKPTTQCGTIGPFNNGDYHKLVWEGREIPYFIAQHMDKDKPDDWYLLFDHRISFGPFTEQELQTMLGPLAYGMAFAAGYACPSAETKFNPHNVQIHGIHIPPKLSVVKKDETDGDK